MNGNTTLHIFSINIRSATKDKIQEIMNCITTTIQPNISKQQEYPNNTIIGIQETWWTTTQQQQPFQTISTNRERPYGGVALLISNNLRFTHREDLQITNEQIETVVIEITNINLIIISYYCPKGTTQITIYIEHINTIAQKEKKQFIFIGDANAKHHLWHSETETSYGKKLANQLIKHQLFCYNNNKSTHYHAQINTESIIDVSFGSIPNLTADPTWYGISDHALIHIPIHNILHTTNPTPTLKKNLSETEWKLFTKLVQEDPTLHTIHQHISLDTQVELFTQCITSAYKKTTTIQQPLKKQNHWFNKNILKEIHIKHKLYNIYKNTKQEADHNKYKYQKNRVQKIIKILKNNQWTSFMKKIQQSTSSKEMWSLFSRARGEAKMTTTPSFMLKPKQTTAELLNEYFSKMGQPLNNIQYNKSQPQPTPINHSYTLNITDIQKIIYTLPNNKSPGKDDITNEMIKHLPTSALQTLTNISKQQEYPNNTIIGIQETWWTTTQQQSNLTYQNIITIDINNK